VLEFPGGLFATVDSSFSIGPSQQSLVISGSNGRIIVSQPFRRAGEPVEIVIDHADTVDYASEKEVVMVPGAAQYAIMAEHFADAVLNDREVDYTPLNSLGNMQALDALKESARTGKAVVPGSR
jgi:predicted dehydrogenase